MSNPTITIIKGRARNNELGDALILSGSTVSAGSPLSDATGGNYYLPSYRPASQTAGGTQAFASSLLDDGSITFFLEAANLGPGNGARPAPAATAFELVLNVSGSALRFPLQAAQEGAIYKLTTQLRGSDLKSAREALFDANPNVAIQVSQTLNLAALQTPEFIAQYWSDAKVRQALLDLFSGIPCDSAARYSSRSSQADPDFPNQFLVMTAVFSSQVAAPPLPGYLQFQVNWQDRAYNYYQDNQDRTRFFYLPEGFQFAKGPEDAPKVSLLQFSDPGPNQSMASTRATFRLYGKPMVDCNRIQNAAQALGARAGVTAQLISLQDAHDLKTSFTQTLPNSQATGSDPIVQANASIDLSAGLRNELSLNFEQFLGLWAAINSSAPDNPLFRGWVDVELSGGKFKERIDFDGRLGSGHEAAFFDSILDSSNTGTYSTDFSVNTFANVFKGSPAVIEVDVMFAGTKGITLTADQLKSAVTIQRSARDIVLGNQIPDQFPYKLQVVKDDGSISCSNGIATTDKPILWINLDQISQCTSAKGQTS